MSKPRVSGSKKPIQKKEASKRNSTEATTEDEVEQDLQLVSSSDEDEDIDENEDELSEDSELSGDEDEEKILNDIKTKVEKSSGHAVNKTSKKSTTNANTKQAKKRGIIYIGRIPHGFHEDEMRKYFGQFGNIINLRLCRNKHGKSKHFGFLEFDSYEVASIAQETMNNYLIFNHILKVQLVDSVHKDLFNQTQTKFKVVPWKKIAKHQHDKPKSEQTRKALSKKFEQSKINKSKNLEAKGINFNLAL